MKIVLNKLNLQVGSSYCNKHGDNYLKTVNNLKIFHEFDEIISHIKKLQ